jgi:methyl-accepting chemotaxis protein
VPAGSVADKTGSKGKNLVLFPLWLSAFAAVLVFEAAAVAYLYWQRATTNLEKHLKPVALVFLLLALAELVGLVSFFRSTDNVQLFNLVRAFGWAWWLEHLLLLAATVVLGRWVWGYLVKRLQSQLFIIFTTGVTIIFLVVSVSFTFLLFRNVAADALTNLEVAGKVLNYSLESKKAETAASAALFAQNAQLGPLVASGDHDKIVTLLSGSLEGRDVSGILVTDQVGKVLARVTEPERYGDSVSADPLVAEALSGKAGESVATKEGVLAPVVVLQAAEPINNGGKQVGVVLVDLEVSSALLDGIRTSTGLQSAVYALDTRAATSIGEGERLVGVKESNGQVRKQVLEEGQTFKGNLSLVNRPYLGVYLPLKNLNGQTVGMIFTGQPQSEVLREISRSVELVFLVSALLLLLSILPAYLVARHISRQVR